jgi:hypothetical protein
MNKQQQKDAFNALIEKAESILLKKGDDYANTDRLSNFKDAGRITGITTQQHCLALIATKVARLGNLYSGKTPNNESIQDSIIDLFNYTALLYMIETEI